MGNLLSEVHPELIEQWSERNLPLTPDKITYGSNKIVWWKGACGHEWQTSIKARSNGENCPICSGARVVEGINDLATLKPELAAEWSSKNKTLKPTMVSVGSHKKVIWKGKCGHEWSATVKSRATNGTGCPYCSHNKILVGFNDLASQRPEIAAEWSEKNYPLKPDMVTAFANRKVWWRCSKGHEWNTLTSLWQRRIYAACACAARPRYRRAKSVSDCNGTYREIRLIWGRKCENGDFKYKSVDSERASASVGFCFRH